MNILFKSAITSVQPKLGFGIGNRNQSPISVSLAVTQKERKDIAKQDLQPYEAARSCAGPKNSTTKSHVIEGKDNSYRIYVKREAISYCFYVLGQIFHFVDKTLSIGD